MFKVETLPPHCEVYTTYSKTCYFYDSKTCEDLVNFIGCEVLKITYDEQKCPFFICKVFDRF
jgi:hypothetical protein